MPFIIDNKVAFIHIPRTAGTWLVEACRAAGVHVKREHRQHADYMEAIGFIPDGMPVFAVTRPAAGWLYSWYCSTAAGGWRGWHNATNCLMRYRADAWEEFLAKYEAEGAGEVTAIWHAYLGPTVGAEMELLAQEDLPDGLWRLLDRHGIDADRQAIRDYPRTGVHLARRGNAHTRACVRAVEVLARTDSDLRDLIHY